MRSTAISPNGTGLVTPSGRVEVLRELEVPPQTDLVSCGGCSLRGVFNFHGIPESTEISPKKLPNGGTMIGWLGEAALSAGLEAHILTLDLITLDPTWMKSGRLDPNDVSQAIKCGHQNIPHLQSYLDFMLAGGTISPILYECMPDLAELLTHYGPLIVGINQTWLTQSARNTNRDNQNPINGKPVGHFLVVDKISGHPGSLNVIVHMKDPWGIPKDSTSNPNKLEECIQTYTMPLVSFWAAVAASMVTHDAAILALRPRQ